MTDDDAPRPLPALRFAGKLEHLKAGEHVAVSKNGDVMTPRGIRLRVALTYGWIGACCAVMFWSAPVVGAVYTAGLGGFIVMRRAKARAFNRIPRLIMNDRLDEAARELDLLDQQKLATAWRAPLANWRAALCWRRGELEPALASARRCLELLPSPARNRHVVYWQNQFTLANLLLVLGRLEEAAPFVAEAMRAPAGEWYRVQQRALEAHRAFATGRHAELGSDDDLHDRVREALRYNHTSITLANLAWAYEQRGDADMATHLLAEVPARLHFTSAAINARMYPNVWAWLGPRLPPDDVESDS